MKSYNYFPSPQNRRGWEIERKIMYSNIEISGIGIEYPEYGKMEFERLQSYYNERNIRIKSLMKILGKEGRFTSRINDNYFGFLEKASQKALKAAEMDVDDLDMVVVATDTPEYLSPTNALRISSILKAKRVKIAFDMNANCASGVIALDQVSSYMKSNRAIENALVICVFMGSYIFMPESPISYCTFSDGVSAVTLRKRNTMEGIIATNYMTDSSYMQMDVLPSQGFSNILRNNKRKDEDLKLGMDQGLDISFIPEIWAKQLQGLLSDYNLDAADISQYLFSQFSLYHIKSAMKKFNLSDDYYTYVGNQYGYTGECSPIFALYEARKAKKIKPNDYIILCGIGAGYTSAAILYKVGQEDLNIL